MPDPEQQPSDAAEWQARLAFEREKWADDLVLRREELNYKKWELSRSGWTNPLVVAIGAAAIAGFFNFGIALYNGQQQLDVEERRSVGQLKLENFKAEAARILAVVDDPDPEVVRRNLEFLVGIGLVSDPDLVSGLREITSGPAEAIPRSSRERETAIGNMR